MRASWVLLVAAACSDDPRLEVIVRHPDGDTTLREAISRTTVTVYESPTLTCGAVELGDIDEQQLDALATAEVTLQDGGGNLEDVARVEHKVIVARSFDAAGALLAIGCGEADDVALGPVEITTELAATVSVAINDEGNAILVSTTDAFSRQLDGRAVSWRAFGPAGSMPAAGFTVVADGVWEPPAPTCTVDGEAMVHPGPPTVPGGFAVRTRVAWAANSTTLVTRFAGFDRQAAQTVPLGVVIAPVFPIVRRCGLHRTGMGTRLVCLADNRDVVAVRAQGTTYVTASSTLTAPAVAVISIPHGDELHTYAVGPAGNWTPLLDSPAVPPGTTPWCRGGPCPPEEDLLEIQVVPACGSSSAGVLARLGDGTTSHLEITNDVGVPGTPVNPFLPPVTGAGCLTELQPDGTPIVRQGIVLGMTTESTSRAVISFPCAATSGTCQLAVNQGAGFITRGEPQLVVTTFDATGVTLSSMVAQPTGNLARDRFIERSRQPAAGIPVQMVTGRFDEDDAPDLFWYFSPQFGTGTNIQVAYGRTAEGSPLTALGNIVGDIEDAFAADLDGNGLDELIALQGVDLLVVKTGTTISIPVDAAPPCD